MSLKLRRALLAIAAVAVLTAGVLVWQPGNGYRQANAATDYQQLQKFSHVMDIVRRAYVEKVSDEKLIEGALSGMLSSLDPHSTYLNKEMYKQMTVDTKGEFGGLGIEISAAEGGIRIVSPIEDTPADRAGVKAGDLIIKIDDQLARDISLAEGVKLMRGKPGTSIVLTIFREGENQPLEVKIVRAIIKVKSVKSDILAPGYAYLRVTQFQERTGKLLKGQISDLKKRSGGSLAGAVLDLRNNPGGLLNQAVEVSDLFLEKGNIVSTKSRAGKSLTFDARAGDALSGLPLIVLINNGSASASEIVAGALQDHHRAVLLGTKSFGKGSVQSVIPLQGGTAIKVTTALYYTPSGRSIQATGIDPDIQVEQVINKPAEQAKSKIPSVSERDLKGHLSNGNKKTRLKKAKKVEIKGAGASAAMQERLQMDTQLQRALDLLRGLHALHAG
ncbi:carboxyl-terminal processing protease [Mariprofundus micogutta]|uniref:Carboxyl-terminal processing protease n=1 Tax=Mariprofundus micogutta TaxID=1921010 RepID=A0A1L8CMG2_9PROT|nr:S41 family peptidase [Mariprofundus micogutta]GAV20097.1 carboxyl-terminal processing protease [Mariprofundus micogutta]